MKKVYMVSFCSFLFLNTMAQAPGGFSTGLTLWLKADAAATLSSLDSLNSWKYANNANTFTATAGSRPIVKDSSFNFLPSVLFSGGQLMDGPTGAGAPITAGNLKYSIFAVWKTSVPATTTPQRVWSQSTFGGSGDGAALWIYNGQYGDQPEISPYTTGVGLPYVADSLYISQVNLLNKNTNDLELIDQTNIATAPLVLSTDPAPSSSATTTRVLSTTYNRLGARLNTTNEPLIGNLAELIVYNDSVSAGTHRNQIFSYLSMKYGIPLKTDLISSTGAKTWDATANSVYNTAVFGLAFDNSSGLSVSNSNSILTGSGNGGGKNAAGNIVMSNPSLSTNGSFLMIGNNGATLTETTTGAPNNPAGFSILQRRWKAQHTGNVGTVTMAFDYTGLTRAGMGGNASNYRLIVDGTGLNDFTTVAPTAYTPATVVGNIVTYNGVTLPNGAVFTFGSSATTLPVTWTNFAASLMNNNIHLNWAVENNQQAKLFEVQHSADGVNFSKVGEVFNNPAIKIYSFAYTPLTEGKHYFRVLESDFDGQAIYSKIINVTTKAANFALRLLNNPIITNSAEFELNTLKSGSVSIELWSVGGARIINRQQQVNGGINRISIPLANTAPGNYILTVRIGEIILHEKVSKL